MSRDWIQIKRMKNGYLVNDRTDSVGDKKTYVFETMDGLVEFIKKAFKEPTK